MVKSKDKSFQDVLEDEFPELLEQKEFKNGAIPTGALSLDVSIGCRGIPLGKFTEIFGSESTGKTAVAMSIAKQALKQGNKVLYNDPEHGLDLDRIKQLLGDSNLENFVHVQPETMEQALRISEYAINSNQFNLIVLDSIASMAPLKVKEGEVDDANAPALLARMFGTFLTRNAYKIHRSSVAFLGVNQVRDKFGAYHKTYEVPGGHQWKHLLSVRISLSKMAEIKKGQDVIGIQAKFVIKKNKLSSPSRSFTIPIMFETGVDTIRDAVNFAKTMGILVKKGPYFSFEGVSLGNGEANTMQYLLENPETLDKVYELCYNLTKQTINYEDEEEEYEQESES